MIGTNAALLRVTSSGRCVPAAASPLLPRVRGQRQAPLANGTCNPRAGAGNGVSDLDSPAFGLAGDLGSYSESLPVTPGRGLAVCRPQARPRHGPDQLSGSFKFLESTPRLIGKIDWDVAAQKKAESPVQSCQAYTDSGPIIMMHMPRALSLRLVRAPGPAHWHVHHATPGRAA